MLLLNKLLPLFVLPLGASLLLLAWGLLRRRRTPMVAALLLLLISSNPLVGRTLIRATEQWAERRAVSTIAPADAIVVLSAGRVLAPGQAGTTEWTEADRYFGGLALMQAGRAPLLVFTGGQIPWGPPTPSEGRVLGDLAITHGVPTERIVVTAPVGNTADEAREVAALLRQRGAARPTVILVTSAFHMPRAQQQFEYAGLRVDPFPVDFSFSVGERWTLLDVMPGLGALELTQTALRELYGRAFYWMRARVQSAPPPQGP